MKAATRRQKGSRVEREVAKRFSTAGIPSRRVVMSGAAARYDSKLSGDLDIGLVPLQTGGLGGLVKAEVKARAGDDGFKLLNGWLGDNDLLIVRQDRSPSKVWLPLDTLLQYMELWYAEKLNALGFTVAEVEGLIEKERQREARSK